MSEGQKIDWLKWLNVVVMLAGLGLFGYLQQFFQQTIDDRVEAVLTDSTKTKAIINRARRVAKDEATKSIQDKAFVLNVAEAFNGFRGMESEALVEYLEKRFNMADSIAGVMPALQANHAFIEKLKNKEAGFQTCGVVLYDPNEKKPAFFQQCNGKLKSVYYGKPRDNITNEVYYYHNDNGTPIVLSHLSTIAISGL